jgi:hypothetical protein
VRRTHTRAAQHVSLGVLSREILRMARDSNMSN